MFVLQGDREGMFVREPVYHTPCGKAYIILVKSRAIKGPSSGLHDCPCILTFDDLSSLDSGSLDSCFVAARVAFRGECGDTARLIIFCLICFNTKTVDTPSIMFEDNLFFLYV